MESKVIVIVGPTCSGKTEIGIRLAKRLNTEIISADSRQIFKLLDIGTAKPSTTELAEIKHHFIDELMPDEKFDVSKFENASLEVIKKLLNQNKIPVVVGGSGLYIKALVDGIFDIDSDENLRDEFLDAKRKYGNDFLYDKLMEVDPVSAKNMLPQNWKRVMRALEVFYITGKPIWEIQSNHKRESNFDFLQFGIEWNREILYSNIENRVDRMMESGLIEEVKKILSLGYNPNLNSLNTVGYKEIISYLKNEISIERAVELIKRNTRRFAKRQLTWFRKDKRIRWMRINSKNEFSQIVNTIISEHRLE